MRKVYKSGYIDLTMEKKRALLILVSFLVFAMLSFAFAANSSENSSELNISTSTSCTDGDGSDYYVKGSVDYKKYSNGNLITVSNPADACVDAIINGIMKEDVLREYFCTLNKEVEYVHYECLNGCSDGACIQNATNQTQQQTCTDSDGGKNYYEKGTTRWFFGSQWWDSTDYCMGIYLNDPSDKRIAEHYCPGGAVEYYGCPNGCSDGACIPAANATNNVSLPIENASASGDNTTSNAAESSASEGGLGSLASANANATGENAVTSEANATCENGCLLNEKCYPFGYRKSGKYCSEESAFKEVSQGNGACENSFECESNLCVNGECLDATLWQRIINWFKEFFS